MLGEAEMAESERNSLISEVEESISYVSASVNGNSVPEKVATECQIYPGQYHETPIINERLKEGNQERCFYCAFRSLFFYPTPPPPLMFSFSNGNSRDVFLFIFYNPEPHM